MSVFTPLDRDGSFTQAVRAPLDFVKFSISWGRTVEPPESVKTMSFPFAWALAARSESKGRLTRTGKLVWVPETMVPLMVSFFRETQSQGLMTRGPAPPPPPPPPQAPQSPGQEEQVSAPSETRAPQMGQAPQSPGQEEQVSPPLQRRSPQLGGQAPQSPGQEEQVSPMLQVPSPQVGHIPQSPGQVVQVSAPLQVPSPQPVRSVPGWPGKPGPSRQPRAMPPGEYSRM